MKIALIILVGILSLSLIIGFWWSVISRFSELELAIIIALIPVMIGWTIAVIALFFKIAEEIDLA